MQKKPRIWLGDCFKWISYWNAAHMVNVDAIQSLEDMHQARRFCSCMSHGLFWDVTDEQFWSALQTYRAERRFEDFRAKQRLNIDA